MDNKLIPATEQDEFFMHLALEEARKAGDGGEVPVGAVIVDEHQKVLAAAGNNSIGESDPAGHAEMVAIRKAGKKTGNYRLLNTTIYVTIEPCVMCAGAMVHARIDRLVYGAFDPKTGGVVSCYQIGGDGKLNHQLNVEGGVLAEECAELLTSFFRKKRRHD
ncbi:tRNA adenosine(34) deaminase TadA [Thermodesulfobacteriota bacterium]